MEHTITRDIIATVTGPGWNYGIARILIDDQGNAAVFVPPAVNGPVQTFAVAQTLPSRGTGLTEDGGQVTWRRRGSGCSFKLAKCHMTTSQLSPHWA